MAHKQSSTKPKPRVAIIGGGFTGLTAAYKLSEQGVEVDVYEAGADLGGLAGGFKLNGTSIEKTYHHIFRTDKSIIALVSELGLAEKLEWLTSSVAIYAKGKLFPFMTPLDLLRFTPLSFINRVRAGVVALFLQIYPYWQQFVGQTAYAWMRKFAGKQVTEVIWYPLLKGKFDAFYDKVSMAWLWARIHVRANSKQQGDVVEKLGYFNGGFQIIIDALVAAGRKAGAKFLVSTPVLSIKSNTKGATLTLPGDKTVTYDKILSTIPSYIFAKLIKDNPSASADYLQQLQSVNYLGAVVLVFTSSQKISNHYWHNINDTTAPFLVFLNHTQLVDKKRYGNEYVYYIGAYLPHGHRYFALEQADLIKEWFKYLQKLFPKFDVQKVRQQHLFKLQNAQHIVDVNYVDKIPAHRTPVPNVFLSNFSQIFPEDRGTNFAVRDGLKVANMILEELN